MKKVFIAIGCLIAGSIVLGVLIFVIISAKSNKMVCKSNEGNITIMYNDKTITGYTAKNISYDLDGQKEIANQIGVEAYLTQFENWFITNTTGSCSR